MPQPTFVEGPAPEEPSLPLLDPLEEVPGAIPAYETTAPSAEKAAKIRQVCSVAHLIICETHCRAECRSHGRTEGRATRFPPDAALPALPLSTAHAMCLWQGAAPDGRLHGMPASGALVCAVLAT